MMDADEGNHYSCSCCISTISLLCAALILTYVSSTVRFYVKVFLYFTAIIAAGTVGGIISLPFGRTPNNHYRMFRLFQWFSSFLRLRFILRNEHYLTSDKAFILIANHQSAIDVLGKLPLRFPFESVFLKALKYFHNHSVRKLEYRLELSQKSEIH
ncbi:hypothetical protein COOONC_01168 [Cooperia oncophora]